MAIALRFLCDPSAAENGAAALPDDFTEREIVLHP